MLGPLLQAPSLTHLVKGQEATQLEPSKLCYRRGWMKPPPIVPQASLPSSAANGHFIQCFFHMGCSTCHLSPIASYGPAHQCIKDKPDISFKLFMTKVLKRNGGGISPRTIRKTRKNLQTLGSKNACHTDNWEPHFLQLLGPCTPPPQITSNHYIFKKMPRMLMLEVKSEQPSCAQ